MTLSYQSAGTAAAASGASPLNITTTVAFAAGDAFMLVMAYDNSGGGGADPISTPTFVGTPGGSFVGTHAGLNDPGTASSGLAAKVFGFLCTGALASGSVIGLQWSGTVVVRAAVLVKISSDAGTVGYRTGSGSGTAVVASAAPALTTASVNSGELVMCYAGHENGANIVGDADTTSGSWGTMVTTFNGSAQTGMAAGIQGKVVTATATQTFNPTGTSSDWLLGFFVFTEIIPPSITQAAYRFYYNGTEAGSVAMAAQDTAPSIDFVAGFSMLVRIRLQNGAGATLATDDWSLQYERNASGSWAAPVAFISTALTEGAATTNRLTGGTGTFVAGKVALDNIVDNLGWAGGSFTELLFAFRLGDANVLNGDTIRLRVLYNGAATSMTYTSTPTFTVTKGTMPQTGLSAWLDASDASTFSYSSGVNVSQWRDKSAAANHFVGPQIGVATRDGTINARTSVRVADYNCSISRTPTPVAVANDNFAMFMVAQRTAGDAANSLMISNGDPAISGYGIASRAGNANTGFLRGGINWAASTTADDGGVHVYTLTRTNGIYGVYIDGVATSLNGTNPGGVVVPANGTYLPSPNSQHSWGGDLCEALIYDRPISVEERLYIEGALKTKWVPVPVGGKIKVWNGSAWVEKPVKVWNGSAWVEKPVKVWNGSAWVLS
jgi:hypothetical protein